MLRHFIRLPVVLVLVLILVMILIDRTGLGMHVDMAHQTLFSVVIFLAGLIIIIIGGYSFRQSNTTVNPLKPEQATSLVTTGVYQLSRNPMYIGFLFWLLACVVYLGNLLNLLFIPVFILLMNRMFIQPEERALTHLFGEVFLEYKKRVRRWI